MQALVGKGLSERLLGVTGRTKLRVRETPSRGLRASSSAPSSASCVSIASSSRTARALSLVTASLKAGGSLANKKRLGRRVCGVSGTETVRISAWYGVRGYSTEVNGAAKEVKGEKASESAPAFGAVPEADSKAKVDAFRGEMRKEAGQLRMEPNAAPKRSEEGSQASAKLSAGPTPAGSGAAPSTPATSTSSGNANATGAGGAKDAQSKAPAPSGRGKRAVILLLLLLGVISGIVTVGAVGGWIDEMRDEREGRKAPGSASRASTSSSTSANTTTDWSNPSQFARNVATALYEWDEKLAHAAMNSPMIESLRSMLGFDTKLSSVAEQEKRRALEAKAAAAKREGNAISAPPARTAAAPALPSSTPTQTSSPSMAAQKQQEEDDKALTIAATVLAATKDVDSEAPSTPVIQEESSNTVAEETPSLEATPSEEAVKMESPATPVPAVSDGAASGNQESTSFSESYETRVPVIEAGVEASSSAAKSSAPSSPSNNSSLRSEELLAIENAEIRMVVVQLMKEMEAMSEKLEAARANSSLALEAQVEQRMAQLREDETKRVMDILKAYEVRVEEAVRKERDVAATREAALERDVHDRVQNTLQDLAKMYEATLEEWSKALEAHVSKWSEEVLSGPVAAVATRFHEQHQHRLALISDIHRTLTARLDALQSYQHVAQESAAYARVAQQWLLLSNKLHTAPDAPFYPQLKAYLDACAQVPQLERMAIQFSGEQKMQDESSDGQSSQSSQSSQQSSSASLLRLSQLGVASISQLKRDFAAASKASRTATLAGEGANAFQHGWASLKEALISSTQIGSPGDATSAASVSANANDNEQQQSKNWAALQKAESLLLEHDALASAVDALNALEGPSAQLMQPWISRAKETLFVQSSLQFMANQTANMNFAYQYDASLATEAELASTAATTSSSAAAASFFGQNANASL